MHILCKAFFAWLSPMAEQEVGEPSKRRQARQPPSVPFLWEERPGVPKKDWTHQNPVVTPPIKLIASVPFSWEEQPGKPLSVFTHSANQTLLPTPLQLNTFPTPQTHFLGCENSNYSSDDGECKQRPLELDLDSSRFGMYDSFSSTPSLPANWLIPCKAISSAVPEQKPPLVDVIHHSDDNSSSDSDTDSSTSSYATGVSSLAGTEFLECLFPLYSHNSGLSQDTKKSNKATPAQNNEHNSSVILRRPHTLGELIMMSRRRSCQRKAVEMAKQNQSTKLRSRMGFGCFILGTKPQMIEGLLRNWKGNQRLKVI